MGFRFMELMLRASIPADRRFLPYFLHPEDAWTDDERAVIHARVLANHPNEVDSMYNTWVFSRYQYSGELPRYSVRRSTWESGQWWSSVLDQILDAVQIHGGHHTIGSLLAGYPDARRITADEAIALPFAWYAEKPEYQRKYYEASSAIWLIDRPHVTCLLHTYDDPANLAGRVYDEQLHFRGQQ